MAKFSLSFSFLCFIVLFSSLGIIGGNMAKKLALEQKTWCVAKPSTEEVELGNNIEFACNQIGVDCSIIQEGGQCYNPVSPINHASVAMNLYFQRAGRFAFNCDFSNSGLIVLTDPSYGACLYSFI